MNLAYIYPDRPGFTCHCYKCGERMFTSEELVLADLDGPPFKAFYHLECTEEADRPILPQPTTSE